MAIVVSVLTAGSNTHLTTSEEANGVYTDFVSEGVVGTFTNTSGVAPATGAFSANAQGTPDNTIAIGAGVAYVTGTPTSQNSQTFRVKNSASTNLTISANSSGSTKYDWIYISLDATKLNTPNTAGDDVATIVASRSSSANSDDGTPPTYGYPIAVVTVANGFSTITNGNIRDVRTQSVVTATSNGTSQDWYSTGAVPSSITYNGNRSYTCTVNTTDLTSFLSTGMRLKMTRTITAPTQCTDLESSSSQYYSKTSPSGLSFTDDFTCMAWVKFESYTAGGIIARRNADTEGWSLEVSADGRVSIAGLRIASNHVVVSSYQSLPLGRWVHVAASLDMSGTSGLIYFDGVLVPSNYSVTGTATALVQGTTALVVGATKSAGTNPFDGKIAQAAVFSAILSASTIRSYMSQTLTGSEPSLVSAYSFNNSIADLNTSNANDLTAQGSAVATATDTPFAGGATGTTEYGIITAISYSSNTTLTVQVPEGYAIPTSGGINAVSYSTQKVPYGFPSQKGKWKVSSFYKTLASTTSSATYVAFASSSRALTVPIGAWDVGYQMDMYNTSTTTVIFNLSGSTSIVGLSDTAGANLSPYTARALSSAGAAYTTHASVEYPENLSSATTFIMYTIGATTGAGTDGSVSPYEIYAEFEYV